MTAAIRLQGAPNFRDFGCCATADGRRVRHGKLFRSEALHRLTTDDHALLSGLGIRLVCDLRSDLERSSKPTAWPAPQLPTTLSMEVNVDLRVESCELSDLLRADPTERGALNMMLHAYRFIPDALAKHLGSFFATAAAEGMTPLLLHCSAGKDRTGVLAALILLLLGVPRETVLADYLKTNQRLDSAKFEADMALQLEAVLGQAAAPGMVRVVAGVRETYLDSAIEAVTARYGSVESYFDSAGVGREQVREFRSRLIE